MRIWGGVHGFPCFGHWHARKPAHYWVGHGPNGASFDRDDRKARFRRIQTMTERLTHSAVTFLHAFTLRDLDGLQPPGTYLIETVEEPLDTMSFLAYQRVATTIALPAVGATACAGRSSS